MLSAICEVKEKEGTYISVSADGTWQRGVCSSLNGVVVAVSTTNSKLVDVEIITRYCQHRNIERRIEKN